MGENLQLSSVPLRRGIPAEKLESWATRYGSTVRTIRRWLETGEEVGDPCPLDDPIALKEWWAKHKTWRLPDAILNACKSEQVSESLPALNESINLSGFVLEEGASVIQARALVAVAYQQLEKAFSSGADVDALIKKHEKALDSLRKAEASDRDAAKQRGALIRREVVEQDTSEAIRMLKQMRENMVRLVLEQLPELGEEIRAKIAATIEKVREHEDGVFRNLIHVPQ